MEACARYPKQRTAIMECVEECEGEYIAITRDRIEEWTQLVREQAALTQFQSLALQAGSSLTTFADLPGLYSQMGEALTLEREEQDFKPIGELVDNYVRKLNEKPKYIPAVSRCWTSTCILPRVTCLSSAADHQPVKPPCPCRWLASRPGGAYACVISALKPTRIP